MKVLDIEKMVAEGEMPQAQTVAEIVEKKNDLPKIFSILVDAHGMKRTLLTTNKDIALGLTLGGPKFQQSLAECINDFSVMVGEKQFLVKLENRHLLVNITGDTDEATFTLSPAH